MPVWSRTKHCLLGLLATLLTATTHAEFRIADVQPALAGETLVLRGNVDFGLTPKVEEALSKGIELPVLIEVRLYRKRTVLWDQRLATWTLRRSLQYHALSGQYLVNNGNALESFLALAESLRQLGTLGELRLPLTDIVLDAEASYRVRVRAHLDIEALPTPLRPVAYTTPSWHLNSGWSAWTVSPAAP